MEKCLKASEIKFVYLPGPIPGIPQMEIHEEFLESFKRVCEFGVAITIERQLTNNTNLKKSENGQKKF